ncbi:tyramine receptor Ser-2-like [Orbicella faveolata]|uniref:tyramine receptor Ser-2-like n=1 Tax=Orbicella faveolata TaxID=48498 RepID=UPI0009E1F34F|nr:tyramine receptor Ser-2-like [Orbicella faveolata]
MPDRLLCVYIMLSIFHRIPINYLLVNLAVADILYVTFISPNVFIIQFSFTNLPDGVTGTVLCKFFITGTLAWVGAASSILTLAVVAVERYYAVVYPLGDKEKITMDNLKVIIPAVWMLSIFINIPPFLIWHFDEERDSCVYIYPEEWMAVGYNLLWDALAFLPLVLMVVSYSRVVYTLWFKQNYDFQNNQHQTGVIRVRKRVTLMVVAVSAIFGICWGTSSVAYTLRAFDPSSVGPVPIAIANTMVLFNAAINPFVYALLNKQFREKMKILICCTSFCVSRVYPPRQSQRLERLEPANLRPSAPSISGCETGVKQHAQPLSH